MKTSPLKKWLLILAGLVCVVLGLIGIVVPLLPTTPFLLLAAVCFAKSSKRLYAWLLNHRWFGAYIRNYHKYRAVSRQVKTSTLILLWATIAFAAIRVVDLWSLRLLLLLVALGVTIHILKLRTLPPKRILQSKTDENGKKND